MDHVEGVHLRRTKENVEQIDALADRPGGRVGLPALLDDLDRRARPARAWGRAVSRAFTWEEADRRTTNWWPQGISTSADADDSERVEGRRVVVVAWYAKSGGSRVTFVDLDTLRYRHVRLVVPRLQDGRVDAAPLKVHAGGIVWRGPYLHVTATRRGFVTCRLDDVLRVDRRSSGGTHEYVLPARFSYRAATDAGQEALRYSFVSLDRSADPAALLAGEYARGGQPARLVRYPLDPGTSLLRTAPDGLCRPVEVHAQGVEGMQGAVVARGRFHVTVSHGPYVPGSVYAGTPGRWRRHRFALPMGPEDIAYWPSTDELWSPTEHPGRRWVVAMPRSAFD